MNKKMYLDLIKAVDEKALEYKLKFLQEYIEFNAAYKIGDIVTDGHYTIKIDAVKNSPLHEPHNPCIVYKGVRLTKKLVQFYSGESWSFFEHEQIRLVKKG
jgi:hypothetical protein